MHRTNAMQPKRLVMKKTLLFIALFASANVAAIAQTSGSVSLSVKLNPIQTIVVNPAQKGVELNYGTKENYANGVASEQADHLNIYSTGGFTVKVKTEEKALNLASTVTGVSGSTSTIEASTISITAANGSTSPMEGAKFEKVNLSQTATTLISNTTGGANKNFNITYQGAGTDAYLNKHVNAEKPSIYKATVTYSIEAS